MNIHSALEMIGEYGDDIALIEKERSYSYLELLHRIDDYITLLESRQIKNSILGFKAIYSFDSIALLFALMKQRCVAVLLSKDELANSDEYFRISNTKYKISDVHPIVIEPLNNSVDNHLIKTILSENKSGIVIFSSGTAGTPKAILHNFDSLISKYEERGKKYSTISFLLMNHIGGINTLLYQMMNGGKTIIVKDNRVSTICQNIDHYQIDLLSTTPSFLNLLTIFDEHQKYDLSSLKTITYGTEPMADSILSRLNKLFPNVKFKQTYGLSEIGILPTKSESSNSIWMKMGGNGYQYKVVDNILWVKGKTSMVGYLNAKSSMEKDGWLNTGDRVELKGDYLRIVCRDSELINVGGLKVYPSEVEDVIQSIQEVCEVLVTSEPNALVGNIVVAYVMLCDYNLDQMICKRDIIKTCRKHLADYKVPAKIYFVHKSFVNERSKKTRAVKHRRIL